MIAGLAGALGALFLALPASAGATEDGAEPDDAAEAGGIDVVQVEGFLDPPNASLVRDSIARAEERGSTVLVLQLNSPGALDTDVDALVAAIEDAEVPITVWVGPQGANARGGAALLALAASWTSVAEGAGIGPVDPVRLDRPGDPGREWVGDRVAALLDRSGRDPGATDAVVDGRLSADRAAELGAIEGTEPTVGELVVALDGETLRTAAGPVSLSTAEVVDTDAGPRLQPNQEVRFGRLDLWNQVLHTLGTPWVAYVLLVVGLALMVFEFYAASVGVAGVVGAGAVVGAALGFSHLPVQWWAVALLLFGIFGLTVDLQAGGLGAWTVIGLAALVAGSLTLYGGSSRLDPAWWIVVLTILGTVVFMVGGMTAMFRSRFATPTVGREGIVGEMGVAEVDIAPSGVLRVRDALWRARTNRATPVSAGAPARVVAVDGLVLEVEPEEGGARDYRDRARGRS